MQFLHFGELRQRYQHSARNSETLVSIFFRFFKSSPCFLAKSVALVKIKISNVSAQRGILRPQHQLSLFDLRERLRCKLKESLLALYTHQFLVMQKLPVLIVKSMVCFHYILRKNIRKSIKPP